MTNHRRIEDTLHINFPVFEGEEPDDSTLETYEEVDFEDRGSRRRDREEEE